MIAKRKTFSHGYEFRNFDGQPQDKLIQIEIPDKVVVPLRQGFDNEVAPVVKLGQNVVAGQIIGRDDEAVSSPVHSSVNGEVIRIEKIDYLGNQTTAITIESDGTGKWQKLEGYSPHWQNLKIETIDSLIYLSGASSLDRMGIPTSFKSSIISPKEVENVIIHGVESEVYNPLLAVLLKDEQLSHFIEGIKILKKLMANARFHLALDKSYKNIIKGIYRSLAGSNLFNIYKLQPKYPLHFEEVLVPTLLGREFPYGHTAANIGVIVLDIQAVLQVYEAVVEGKPLIERTVALCGPGFRENYHINVRIGTKLEHVIKGNIKKDKDLRFIHNSCLTGETLSDLSLPVDRTFTTIIAMPEENESEFLAFARLGFQRDSYSRSCFSMLFKKNSKLFRRRCGTNVHGELRPCLFCTFCDEVCPVGIIPHLLFHYVERDIINEALLRYKIFNCIECNLCSYVCPSKIPVAKFIKEGKAKLLEEGFEIPAPDAALKGIEKHESVK